MYGVTRDDWEEAARVILPPDLLRKMLRRTLDMAKRRNRRASERDLYLSSRFCASHRP